MSNGISDDFRVTGDITLRVAERYKSRGIDVIDGAKDNVKVDLGDLDKATSDTVAAMLGWQRHASLNGISIVFVNKSHDLRKIIEVSGLSHILK